MVARAEQGERECAYCYKKAADCPEHEVCLSRRPSWLTLWPEHVFIDPEDESQHDSSQEVKLP